MEELCSHSFDDAEIVPFFYAGFYDLFTIEVMIFSLASAIDTSYSALAFILVKNFSVLNANSTHIVHLSDEAKDHTTPVWASELKCNERGNVDN